jgi:hypothetical protein
MSLDVARKKEETVRRWWDEFLHESPVQQTERSLDAAFLALHERVVNTFLHERANTPKEKKVKDKTKESKATKNLKRKNKELADSLAKARREDAPATPERYRQPAKGKGFERDARDPARFATQHCNLWTSSGACTYGTGCRYLHDPARKGPGGGGKDNGGKGQGKDRAL